MTAGAGSAAAAPDAVELVLLRHGETAWNRERRIQGQLDVPLNDEGLRQARAAARRLAAEAARWRLAPEPGRPPAVLLSSDLQRCRQTAEPIAAALGLETAFDARLRERGYGPFERRTYDEVRREAGALFDRWLAGDPSATHGDAETLHAFAARVRAAIDDLVSRHPGRTLLVVTHGGVLDVLHRAARAMPLEAPRDFEVPNAGLNRLRASRGALEILDWADVAHWTGSLDEIGPHPAA